MTDEIKKDAKVLIVSWSPVPTPKYQKIEGSGQRFFGLATGLQKNGIRDITIAVGTIYPLDVNEVNGIKLINYDFNDTFAALLADYDTIIFNYAIHGSAFIAKNLPKNTQVILDAYGPAYIESLARDPEDLVGTYVGNLAAVRDVFNKVLTRGDYFLYANDAQEKFYMGVLATLGVINQFSYHTKRLLNVPFGIDMPNVQQVYDNPYTEYGVRKGDFVVLWFGGLYPWFDITKILNTLLNNKRKNLKLVIVGGNNPQNQHPDFVKHYHNTVDYIKQNGLEDQTILIDWVDYATRRKYYEHADVIVSMNNESKENIYSWRTRVMDYVGSQTPLVTNGGDPLSDELIEVGAAFKIDNTDEDSVQTVIEDLATNKAKLTTASKNMRSLQPKYYWESLTKELAEIIHDQKKPYSDERNFRLQNNIAELTPETAAVVSADTKRSLKTTAYIVAQKIRNEGPKATYKIIHDKVQRRAAFEYKKRFPSTSPQTPRIVIVSNQLNNTGAPFVIMDIVHNLKRRHPELSRKIKFITFTPIVPANISRLEKDGVAVEVFTNKDLSLELRPGDIVVFNTFSVSRTMALSAIHAVKHGQAKKLYWYGHESSPEGFIDSEVRREYGALLKANKAKLYAVSEATLQEYTKFFGTTKNAEKMPFRFTFPEEKFKIRSAHDFDELRFVSIGSLMDMRKGQYPLLYAFLDFYHNYYKKTPSAYRNFLLEFIGAYEKSDLSFRAAYHVKNIKKQFDLSAQGLDNHFIATPTMSHEDAIRRIEAANVTVCYSLHEALPIFVYEGMATGHPIVRNDSPGQEEQLVDGKNGLAVSSRDFAGLVEAIEKLLNKNKTSNEDLAKMSQLSNEIARKATTNEYAIIEDIQATFESL